MVRPALQPPRYQILSTRGPIGTRPNGRKHIPDLVVEDERGRRFIVSLKWQQESGTAEHKVPFEVISLAHAMEVAPGRYARAFVVLGGNGWTTREFYTSGGLHRWLSGCDDVEILDLDTFVGRANRGHLLA